MFVGSRTSICNGDLPQTPEEKETEIKKKMKSQWTTYVIVAALVRAMMRHEKYQENFSTSCEMFNYICPEFHCAVLN